MGPIIVVVDGAAGGVQDGDEGIGDDGIGGDTKIAEAGADSAHEQRTWGGALNDDTGNEEVAGVRYLGEGREVSQAGGVFRDVVNFGQDIAGRAVDTLDGGGVAAGGEVRQEDGGIEIARGESECAHAGGSGGDLRSGGGAARGVPALIGRDEPAGVVVDLETGGGNRGVEAELGEGGADAADEERGALGAAADVEAEGETVTDEGDFGASREVDETARGGPRSAGDARVEEGDDAGVGVAVEFLGRAGDSELGGDVGGAGAVGFGECGGEGGGGRESREVVIRIEEGRGL